MVEISPLYTCLRSHHGRILIKQKKVTPSLSYQEFVQGYPLFAPFQCRDFRISNFYSVISLHSTLPLAIWNSETLGRVINFTFEKLPLWRASGPCHSFRLLRGQTCPHGGTAAKEYVPRPSCCPLYHCQARHPRTALGNAAETYLCPVVSLITVKRVYWRQSLEGEGPLYQDFTCRSDFYFQYWLSRWKSLSPWLTPFLLNKYSPHSDG